MSKYSSDLLDKVITLFLYDRSEGLLNLLSFLLILIKLYTVSFYIGTSVPRPFRTTVIKIHFKIWLQLTFGKNLCITMDKFVSLSILFIEISLESFLFSVVLPSVSLYLTLNKMF